MRREIFNIFFVIMLLIISINILSNVCIAQIQPIKPEVGSKMVDQNIKFAEEAGFEVSQDIPSIIAAIIKGFLALLGVIFIILILIAGYNWMIAAGDEEKVRKAKDTIQRAIIGLLIIVAAYAITYFVFKYMPWGGGGMGSQT